jgi:hypothetical protein
MKMRPKRKVRHNVQPVDERWPTAFGGQGMFHNSHRRSDDDDDTITDGVDVVKEFVRLVTRG